MEFTIDRDAFARALARMQGIVEKKSTMAVLSNALIRAEEDGGILIAATDLDVTLIGKYPASVERAGALTLNARALYDIVRNLPPGELALIAQENNYVEIRHGNIEFRMVAMSADEFPALPDVGDVTTSPINKRLFFSMIEGVIFSVSTDDTRPNLNGVLVKPAGPEALMMVSTDGHRLSKVVRHVGVHVEGLPEDGVIIPRKGLAELKRVMDDPAEEIAIGVQASQVVFRSETDMLFVRLIDGVFPDFNRVIPKTNRNVARLERDQFMTALRRTSLFAQAKTMGIRIALMSDGRMRITASNPDMGRAQEELDVDYAGDAMEIGYNAKYLLDCLGPLDAREVRFEMNDDLSPGIIRVDGDEESFYVVMPMRL